MLHEDLATLRDQIDKFYADSGRYPDTLQALVARKHRRSIPVDPITGSAESWVVVPPENPGKGGVYDVRSGTPEKGPFPRG